TRTLSFTKPRSVDFIYSIQGFRPRTGHGALRSSSSGQDVGTPAAGRELSQRRHVTVWRHVPTRRVTFERDTNAFTPSCRRRLRVRLDPPARQAVRVVFLNVGDELLSNLAAKVPGGSGIAGARQRAQFERAVLRV